MTKEILTQYANLQKEAKETREKIDRLETDICKIMGQLDKMVSGKETVKDKVYGGYGGQQGFVIEGFPNKEYEDKRSVLMMKRVLLNSRKSTLEMLEFDILKKTNEVEEFIAGIEDSHIRRIINLRVIEGLSWTKVADKIGGGNTEGSVKMAFQRFME